MLNKVFIDKEDHTFFKLILNDAISHITNLNPNQMAEFLAKFLDLHLKKSTTSQISSDQALEELTNQVI